MTVKVVLAGCGNMGYAMLRGWLTSGQLEPTQTFIVEPNAQLRARAQELGSAVGAAASTRAPASSCRPTSRSQLEQ